MFLGTIHFQECPVQPNLPIYVTVIGATGLLSLLVMYLRNTLDDCLLARFCSAFSFTLYLFIVCWFIAGERKICYITDCKKLLSVQCQSNIFFIIYLNNSETKINAVLSGTYWIYSIYPPNYVPTSTGDHCHRTLYLFAFWINNLGFLCVFILSLLCLYTILTCRHILFNRMLYVKI